MAEQSLTGMNKTLADYDDYEPLPAGTYPAVVDSAEERTGRGGGQYFHVTLLIDPKDFPPDYDEENNPEGAKLVFASLRPIDPVSPDRRAITALKKFLRIIGIDPKTVAIDNIDPAAWIGRELRASVVVQEYNGQLTNSVDAIKEKD